MINIGVVGTEVTALTTTLKIKLGTYVRFFILYLRNPFKNKIAHFLSTRDSSKIAVPPPPKPLIILQTCAFLIQQNRTFLRN